MLVGPLVRFAEWELAAMPLDPLSLRRLQPLVPALHGTSRDCLLYLLDCQFHGTLQHLHTDLDCLGRWSSAMNRELHLRKSCQRHRGTFKDSRKCKSISWVNCFDCFQNVIHFSKVFSTNFREMMSPVSIVVNREFSELYLMMYKYFLICLRINLIVPKTSMYQVYDKNVQ